MIFLTVGTQFSFDRLIIAIDKAIGQRLVCEDIFGQIGKTFYKPDNFQYVDFLVKADFDSYVNKADALISHAGMGAISMAMEYGKPLLVMPRLKEYKEVVNNHQVEIAKRFEQSGHLLAAYNPSDLVEKIKQLKAFVPRKRKTQIESVSNEIANYLSHLKM